MIIKGKNFKKLFVGALVSAAALSFIACGTTDTATESNSTNGTTNSQTATNKDKTPIKLEDLALDVNVLPANSIGTVYMEATYTNNSDKTLTGYNVTVKLPNGEKTYLSCYDTVLPGETSPKFECFGPESGNFEECEILKYEFTVTNDDGSKTYVEYDNKLKTYSQY
jgi:hypothetical protein